jgi:hypothetical protein
MKYSIQFIVRCLMATAISMLGSVAFAQDTEMNSADAVTAEPPVAENQTAAAATPGEAAPEDRPTIPGGKFGAFTGINTGVSQSYVAGFYTLDPGIILGLGLDFGYNKAGQADPVTGAATTDEVRFGLVLDFEYFVYNKGGIAVGPQLLLRSNIAPGDAFGVWGLAPGLAFWYTPWQAPVAIGASWNVDFTFIKGGDNPVINTFSPSLRLAWILG